MEFIEIKNNDCWKSLVDYLGVRPDILHDKILNTLDSCSLIEDGSEDFGRLIFEIVEEGGISLPGVIVLSCGRMDERVKDLFGGLVIIGKYDCVECGGETETYVDEENGEEVSVKRCFNCGYREMDPVW